MSYQDFQHKVYSYLIKYKKEMNCTPKVLCLTFGVQFKNHGDCFGLILKRLLFFFQFKRFEIEVG